MQKFDKLTAVAAPLPIINVDTDMIIPARFLKTIKRTGLGKSLFYTLRFDENGNEREDFVLNKTAYKGVMEKSKKQLGDDAAKYLLFYKGKLKEYKNELKLTNKDTPHFYVLDENGKIVYIAKGKCSDKKLDEIDSLLPND